VVPAEAGSAIIPGVWLKVRRSGGTKCVRCWHLTSDVGSVAEHPELCGRCAGNIGGAPERRRHV
jgi:isoleucyl-tRNA synthetase